MPLLPVLFIPFITAISRPLPAPEPVARTIYVSPVGNDRRDGLSPARAVASLEGARNAVRRLKAAGFTAGTISVRIANGRYPMAKPVEFGPEDSGSKALTIEYAAAPGANPILDGGRPVRGWHAGADGVWTADVAEVKSGARYFEQLWVNGHRAQRARNPKRWYLYMAGKVEKGTDPATGKEADLTARAFIVRPEDVGPWVHDKNATVVVYHSWEISEHHIAGFEDASRTLVLTGKAPWPFFAWGPNQRYHVENAASSPLERGEWQMGRDGQIRYRPVRGETLAKAEIIAPVSDAFIRIEGTPDRKVTNIHFRGLRLAHSQYVLPSEGHGDGQAEFSIPAVIQADHATNVTFQDCEIAHTGIYGIWLRQGCTDCKIERCYLHDLGAGGVRIGEGEIRPSGPLRTNQCVVDNNIIHGLGKIHMGCIGVWIGQSGGNRITHNDISDIPYTGVSIGWTWGYAESLAQDNHIDNNHIHHLGWGVLSDMGGVYTLGNEHGTTVNNSHIHDVYSYSYGGWGLYTDEGTTDITMSGNIVHDVKTGGFHQHYGKDNLITNNILAFSQEGQIQRTRVESHLSYTFSHNIVIYDRGPLLTGDWSRPQTHFEQNLYWNTRNEPILFAGKTFQEWQALGEDKGSQIADPRFVDAAKRDFRLETASPAFVLGIRPIDPPASGVYGPASWKRLAASLRFPKMEYAPPPPK